MSGSRGSSSLNERNDGLSHRWFEFRGLFHREVESDGLNDDGKDGHGSFSNVGTSILEAGYDGTDDGSEIQIRGVVCRESFEEPGDQRRSEEGVWSFETRSEAGDHRLDPFRRVGHGGKDGRCCCSSTDLGVGEDGADGSSEELDVLVERLSHSSCDLVDAVESGELDHDVRIDESSLESSSDVA